MVKSEKRGKQPKIFVEEQRDQVHSMYFLMRNLTVGWKTL